MMNIGEPLPSTDPGAVADLAQAALGHDAVALSRIVRGLLDSPEGGFFEAGAACGREGILAEISHQGVRYGRYWLSGRSGGYGSPERDQLHSLATLTGRLLHMQANAARRAEELSLAEAQNHRQAQMLDQIHDSVITMDLAGYVTSWNKGAERLFGYTAEEAIGRNILFLYVDEGDDDAQFRDAFLESGGREMEVRRRRKSGEVFWASLLLSLMRDADGQPSGMIGYLSDITDRLEAEERLRLHARIFEHSEEGILITDAEERVVSVNNAFCRITGYADAEVLGRPMRMFDADNQDGDFYQRMWDAVHSQGSWHGETWGRKKNGERFPKWASVSIMKSTGGNITHYFSIFSDVSERKRAEERINYLAYYDALTGLPNRTLLQRLVSQALFAAERDSSHGALLFIDLNRFKPINDTLGHEVGDRLLQMVGERFRKTLRREDVIARLGGDEFVVALFHITQREHAGVVAQKLLEALEDPFVLDDNELNLGASIGISVYPEDGNDTETLLRYADVAMYRAKQANHDRYMFYSHEMNQRAISRLKIETGLRQALERGELLLHYQPKVDIASGSITGAEALLRWHHPVAGMISPGEFVPVAEESGLIIAIGAWVLEEACTQALAWRRSGLPPLKVAVNISARQFTAKLPNIISTLLARTGLDTDGLELELTESMLMHGIEDVIGMMNELHGMGITLSLDDFGTGFSSLSYLKRFPIDALKIDPSFVGGIPDDPSDSAIAGAIVGMAKFLGHKVIAEGVESTEQLSFLRGLGCDEIQGYLFSAAVPAATFEAMLRENRRLEADYPAAAVPMRASATSKTPRGQPKLRRTKQR